LRVKCLAQEHNAMSPARVQTRTARSGDESADHEAAAVTVNQETIIVSRVKAFTTERRKVFATDLSSNSNSISIEDPHVTHLRLMWLALIIR